ncbi:uncharacterized protein BO95DRAFT_294128 [Aspergillus brunneoviolaceus CBS 621.78]|uniref:Uncharacterized protein n=1 Tax=Aspergillus brunneoviolaceus CBS 621.78 TaxID=1450534 RepID=A0ACD1FUE8_9EURO|nr:hypothetical protein BO95DRAFT_294128 [Aspergillus brunneoviolaceus CBS 621.78]RAH40632.1 hypothetical protein BO95DRAFT_294128 [Aspergillus brunneoviolaceus CBS 621.78]
MSDCTAADWFLGGSTVGCRKRLGLDVVSLGSHFGVRHMSHAGVQPRCHSDYHFVDPSMTLSVRSGEPRGSRLTGLVVLWKVNLYS